MIDHFACVDPRVPSPAAALAMRARLVLLPGLDGGSPEQLYRRWRADPFHGEMVCFCFHQGCEWHLRNDAEAAATAIDNMDYFAWMGVPAVCLKHHQDGYHTLVAEGVPGSDHELLTRIQPLLHQEPRWLFRHDAKVNAIHIGHGHRRLEAREVLRLSTHYFTEEIYARIGHVIEKFRAMEQLVVRFSDEVTREHREIVLNLFRQHQLPVLA